MILGIRESNQKIVTDGMVLHLDAAQTLSYTSGSSTWFDLSGNNKNGTLTNGPTYTSSFGGGIVFDGTNDYIQFTSVSVQTVCFWGRMDSDIPALAGLVCSTATGDGSLRTEGGSFRAVPNSDDFHNGYVSSLMINGVSNLSVASNYLVVPNGRTLQQDFYVGAIGNSRSISTISHTFLNRVYKGRVYSVSLYNRKLTNSELLQNYNVTKTRFGL